MHTQEFDKTIAQESKVLFLLSSCLFAVAYLSICAHGISNHSLMTMNPIIAFVLLTGGIFSMQFFVANVILASTTNYFKYFVSVFLGALLMFVVLMFI